jgi:hypothetical protein
MVGTVEEAVSSMRRKDIMDGLSDWDKRVIGRACRLEVPLSDAYTLRRIADLLRGFAAMLDNHSRRTDLSERAVLYDIKAEAMTFNARVRELHGIDKFNKNGSTRVGDKS